MISGHVVYAVEGTVFAAPFDTRSLSVLPGTVPLVDGVAHEGSAGWASAFDVSREARSSMCRWLMTMRPAVCSDGWTVRER